MKNIRKNILSALILGSIFINQSSFALIDVSTEEALNASITNSDATGAKLLTNIEVSNSLGTIASQNFELDGNGFSLTSNTNATGIYIESDVTFSLYNLSKISGFYSSSNGGVIENYGTITKIISSFYDNNASNGGAIYNRGDNVYLIEGDFYYNNATSYGGAIYNNGVSAGNYIDTIKGNFVDNSAKNGGAIYNASATSGSNYINSIEGDFTGNNGTSTGGAIANYGTINYIEATFSNNYISGTMSLMGGAIMNSSSDFINNIVASFVNNYVETSKTGSIYTKGGAIYNAGTIKLSSNEGTCIYNYGNYVVDSNDVKYDTGGGFLYSNSGNTTFDTASNSYIIIGSKSLGDGYDSIAGTGTITKTGAGTLIVNSSMYSYTGSLAVEKGTMEVNNYLGASSISITSGATLSLTIIGNDTLNNSSLSYSNSGTLKLIAGTSLEATTEYDISANDSLDFSANSIAYGGTISGNTFKTSAIQTGISIDGTGETAISVTSNDIVNISSSSSSSDPTIVMSFNSSNATVTSVSDVSTSLADSAIIGTSEEVLIAFDFDVSLSADDSVVLSFLVGTGYDLSDFTVYHKSDTANSDWEQASEISDLSYDGEYLSFIVESFSSYGITAVPEPSTYAMILGALALGLAMYRRRK